MKVNNKNYNLSIIADSISQSEMHLNNQNMQQIFNFFDIDNKKGDLSSEEIKKIFGFIKSLDNENNKADGILSDNEIANGLKKLGKNNTAIMSDLKQFICKLCALSEGKVIAKKLHNQISGPSWYKNTLALLNEITPENVIETYQEYQSLVAESLANDVDNEMFLDIEDVKKYICLNIANRAKQVGITLSVDYRKLNTLNDVNKFIKESINKIQSAESAKIININKVGDVAQPYSEATIKAMSSNPKVKTNLLKIAQKNLGLQEVTPEEYEHLSNTEKQNTQMKVIGKNGDTTHQWCAHTVSYLSEQAGLDIGGHKKGVWEFISWATKNKTYRPIKTTKMTDNNYAKERAFRAAQIKQQLSNMHEGDFIIWKSQYMVKLSKNSLKENSASHIGIIESVNVKTGTVTVIEGNANISRTSHSGGERILVKNEQEGIMGNQDIGEYQELNRRDGLIRKTYIIDELAKFGYSGYIDNQKIIK